MQTYRAYKLNAAGKIVAGEWIEAANDHDARAAATALCDHATPTVELWQGARWLGALPCDDEAAQAG